MPRSLTLVLCVLAACSEEVPRRDAARADGTGPADAALLDGDARSNGDTGPAELGLDQLPAVDLADGAPPPDGGVVLDAASCTKIVQPGAALDTVANAASPGDVICLHAGTYAGFTMSNSGTASAPIVIRAYPGEELQAKLTNNSSTSGYGVRVNSSAYLVIEGLWIDKVNQGIYVKESDHIQVRYNKVTEVGQECLRFKLSDFGAFVGNTVKGCGRKTGANGEGIYVGSGESPGDDTHGALVSGNDVSDTTHEGIELKGFTHDCIVEGNRVHDLSVHDGGGIHVTTTETTAPNESGHIVRGNVVYNITTVTSYADGNGINFQRGGQLYNNVLYGNQHYGLRVDDKRGLKGTVKVYHNTMYQNASGALGVYDGLSPDVRNNLGPTGADNLAAAAQMFVKPASGDFHLVSGAAPIDKGSDVGVATDIEGVSRPQGAGYDYGAHERPGP